MLTFVAIVTGGIFALNRYRREVRLRAADLLLKMEEEFRNIVPVCMDVEDLERYATEFAPVLRRDHDKAPAKGDLEILFKLDRCLRFFFLCTILNADLKVEENVIARAHYYYLCVMAEPDTRPELEKYIQSNFQRLYRWINCHRKCMDEYRKTGDWDESFVTEESL